MTYKDLIEELQSLSSQELQQHVTFMNCEDHSMCVSSEEVDGVLIKDLDNQIYILY